MIHLLNVCHHLYWLKCQLNKTSIPDGYRSNLWGRSTASELHLNYIVIYALPVFFSFIFFSEQTLIFSRVSVQIIQGLRDDSQPLNWCFAVLGIRTAFASILPTQVLFLSVSPSPWILMENSIPMSLKNSLFSVDGGKWQLSKSKLNIIEKAAWIFFSTAWKRLWVMQCVSYITNVRQPFPETITRAVRRHQRN